ncbi:MAG: S24 family peptidase [Sphingomonadales bacterium]
MLTHENIWQAIDLLAKSRRLSVSGLAKRSGLDPTAFNRSKRISRNGKKRWPSTESIAKILIACDTSLTEFVGFVEHEVTEMAGRQTIPVINLSGLHARECFSDAGEPKGVGWGDLPFPRGGGGSIYALDITGDDLEPVYKHGDTMIVTLTDSVRRGDRVVAGITGGELLVATMGRLAGTTVEFHAIGGEHEVRSFPRDDVLWISRIIWAAQ